MKRLSTLDASFLMMEKRQQPMHVGGLQLFSIPKDAPRNFLQELARQFREIDQVKPPYDRRLSWRLGQAHWIEDPHFDLEHHFRHLALPKPGRIRELLTLVSHFHSTQLDRSRPLWEAYLIEGVQGRRFGLYSKLHHALVDGVAAMKLAEAALTTDPNKLDLLPPWAMGSRAPAPAGSRDRKPPKSSKSPADILRDQYGMVRGMAGNLLDVIKGDEAGVSPLEAPRSPLNVGISSSRRFAAQSWSLERLKAVGAAMDATINDVVLAMCASALRQYLISINALPDKPLIAMVPVSVAPKDKVGQGNNVAMILANLGTNMNDPISRMQAIQRSMKVGKERFSRMTQSEIAAFTILLGLPATLQMGLGIGVERPLFNVTISNVPGPRERLYWNGARLEGMYPVSIPVDGQALNITCASYVDSIEFGVTACRRSLPSIQRLLDYLEKGLQELERALR